MHPPAFLYRLINIVLEKCVLQCNSFTITFLRRDFELSTHFVKFYKNCVIYLFYFIFYFLFSLNILYPWTFSSNIPNCYLFIYSERNSSRENFLFFLTSLKHWAILIVNLNVNMKKWSLKTECIYIHMMNNSINSLEKSCKVQ